MSRKIAKWDDGYYVKAYRAARGGVSDGGIAGLLGVSPPTLAAWREDKPALDEAIRQARDERHDVFRDYVWERLGPEEQATWDEINRVADEPNATARMDAMFAEKGKAMRQSLFVYAWVRNGFNMAKAARAVGVTSRQVRVWQEDDLDFADLIREIDVQKKHFFQDALMQLVAEGDTSAVLFANRTYNRDWYGERHEVSIEKRVEQTVVHIDALNLPLETRRQLLAAMAAGGHGGRVLEAQARPIEEDEGRLAHAALAAGRRPGDEPDREFDDVEEEEEIIY